MTRLLRVLVVGQTAVTPGGIAAVQRLHEQALAGHPDVELTTVATYEEGPLLRRLVVMVAGLVRAGTAILAGRVDVLHVHAAKGLSAVRKGLLLTLARRRGVVTVLHTHAGAFAAWFDALPPAARRVVRALLRADRVVVLAAPAREVYTTRLSVPADAVVVLPNPVVWPTHVAPRPAASRVEMVFLGRLIDRKGVFDLLDALAALTVAVRDRLHVTLAGHGDADAVRRHVTAAGLDTAVTVHGLLGHHARDALLERSEVLLLPSWWEALPMAVLEGMAHGLVPVVTPVGGLPDLVHHGVNGVLVPLRDPHALATALEKLVADGELRAQLGAAARADVRPLGTDTWGERVVALYRQIPPDPPEENP